ncbi:hypothetical protein EII14_08505 [Alloprevotella sp. OH1205_COT-284]|nr:hypothetical protein EII14_08505 [Alloprevotella sp. OH1205_COT-284]
MASPVFHEKTKISRSSEHDDLIKGSRELRKQWGRMGIYRKNRAINQQSVKIKKFRFVIPGNKSVQAISRGFGIEKSEITNMADLLIDGEISICGDTFMMAASLLGLLGIFMSKRSMKILSDKDKHESCNQHPCPYLSYTFGSFHKKDNEYFYIYLEIKILLSRFLPSSAEDACKDTK